MDTQAITVKLFAEPGARAAKDALVTTFHRWIQERVLDEVLIDVVDYSHVYHGPGVMLIAHGAHYGMDEAGGRLGLLYAGKRGAEGTLAERLTAAIHKTLAACRLLEAEPALGGLLRFGTSELVVGVNDRLAAPNTPATYAAFAPALSGVLDKLYGEGRFTLTHLSAEREPFRVQVRAESAPALAALSF